MNPRVDGLRVVAFTPRPEPSAFLRKAAIFERMWPEMALALERSIDNYQELFARKQFVPHGKSETLDACKNPDREGA